MGRVRHELRDREGRGEGLALILSGLRYGCDRPLLAGSADLLAARGHALRLVDFGYAADAGYAALGDAAQIAMIEADGAALLDAALADAGDHPLTILGKSLGTVAMGGMVASGRLPAGTRLAWLTPSLRGTDLFARMTGWRGPSFSLIGSRDPSVEITRSPAYLGLPRMTHVEIESADHGWTHPAGDDATRRIEEDALNAIAGWLDAEV